MPVSLSACSYQWHTNRTNGANREASLTSRYPLLTVRLGLAFWQFVCFDNSYVYVWISFSKRGQIHQSRCGFQGSKLQPVNGQSFCLPVILTTLGTRGLFSRVTGSFVSSAKGRRHERRSHSLFKTWPKAETAREKPLAPRLHFDRIRK